MKKKISFAGILCAVSGLAWSQMTPQMQQQLPPSDPSSSQYNSVYLPSLGQGDTVRPNSNVRWEDRWGAIADDGNGVYGIVTDLGSRRLAQKAAVAECRRRGGGECMVGLAYYNQCAVVVAGTTGAELAHAPTEDQAKKIAVENCEATDGQGVCRVYYSGCSLPVPVQ